MWFNLQPWTVEEAEKGKHSIQLNRTLNCSADKAFEAFNNQNLKIWFDDITGAEWLSNEKECVGAVRQVNLKTMKVKEHFLKWENNKRFAFYLEAASLPLINAMIEDCQFNDVGDGRCEFNWNIYYQPTFITGLLLPIIRPVYTKMFEKAINDLEEFVWEK